MNIAKIIFLRLPKSNRARANLFIRGHRGVIYSREAVIRHHWIDSPRGISLLISQLFILALAGYSLDQCRDTITVRFHEYTWNHRKFDSLFDFLFMQKEKHQISALSLHCEAIHEWRVSWRHHGYESSLTAAIINHLKRHRFIILKSVTY